MLSFMPRPAFVRTRILEAAFDRFAVEGYEAVSTRDIAAAAKVGAASMFKHFPTKEALGRELYAIALAPLAADTEHLLADQPTPRVACAGFVRLLGRWYDTRPRALALLVFPPHAFTPRELDPANPETVRNRMQRAWACDEDIAAVVWGACTGPFIDRYLRRRQGAMADQAAALAPAICRLLPEET